MHHSTSAGIQLELSKLRAEKTRCTEIVISDIGAERPFSGARGPFTRAREVRSGECHMAPGVELGMLGM